MYSESYSKFLNNLGLKIKHANKELLELNDIFVYPDLEHVTSKSAITYKEISSKNL